ncbi:hypothetical protein RCL1_007033 [Eukaryota sp. TZLM3-RCL]
MSYVPPAKRQQQRQQQFRSATAPLPAAQAGHFPGDVRFAALRQDSQSPPPYRKDRGNLPRSRSFETRYEPSEQEVFGATVNTGINFSRYDDIPVETSANPPAPAPITLFTDVDLPPQLKWNVNRAGFEKPTPVQKYSIPVALAKRDLMSCAQTGSGKTAAFLIPVIADLINNPALVSQQFGSRAASSPSCLVLAPTRELASQIHNECRKFAYRTGLKSSCIYGGTHIGPQLQELARGCDILVATPGRLIDVCERGRVVLTEIRHLVLDEADRMLDMGFEPQIRSIVGSYNMPETGHRRTLMFSATFPPAIQHLASDFLDNYVFLAVGRVGSTTNNITQRLEKVSDEYKHDVLLNLLHSVPGLTLIFVETKKGADILEQFLSRQGFNANSIHGDRDQREREDALRAFRTGVTPILVATDVASRGLDIPNVSHVINYDMPNDIEDYVHRIGRTGRAGNVGISTSFVSEKNRNLFERLRSILEEANQEIPSWFNDMCRAPSRSFGGYQQRRGGSGGSRYGARDYRRGGPQKSQGGGQRSWSGSFDDY